MSDLEPDSGGAAGDRGSRALRGFVWLGIGLRVAYYLLDFPLWWDEAFVAVNLLRRGPLDLLRPLDYGQVCPLLFLWAEAFAVRWLGFSEWSLRLYPLLCSIASVVLFRYAAGLVLGGRGLLLAVAVFAVSTHPIKHAADVKPYASDALVSLALLAPALAWARSRGRVGPLWALSAVVPLALLASHPSIFVAGGIFLALLVPAWRAEARGAKWAMLAYGSILAATYALIYVSFTRDQASSASPGMSEMWWKSFPPLESVVGMARWLVVVHSGEMLAYPCGGEGGGSVVSLVLCVVGGVVLWRGGRGVAMGCLVGSLGVALVAAGLRKYPYGGPAPHGSSARVMQYAAPALCLLIGQGAARALEWARGPGVRLRACRVLLAGLVVVGIAPVASSLGHPYRAYQAEAARRFARGFWPEVGRGAEVACLRWDLGVAEWDSIRLGIAVSLCDQAIYSPSRHVGGPDWSKVSKGRPLRCVLGVAGPPDRARVEAWLASMRGRYALRKREAIEMVASEPGRPRVVETYEVFEFEPLEVAGP